MRNSFKYMILLGILGSSTAALAAPPTLEMVGGGGSVTVKRASQSLKLKKGETLQAGDEVVTDRATSVDIRFEDKTLVRVGANSSYRLEEDSKLHSLIHRLVGGVVRVLVPKRSPRPEGVVFQMQTPEGTIGVRGTEFTVTEGPGRTTLKGLDGDVMFGASGSDFANDASFVHVKKGFQSMVQTGGVPSAPTSFDLDSYLKELKDPAGPFGTLRNRDQAAVKTRGSAVASTSIAPTAEVKVAKKTSGASESPAVVQAEPVAESQEQKLFSASSAGNLPAMTAAIKAGANVNKPMLAGATSLHVAVLKNQPAAVKLLLSSGAKVDVKDQDGRTPLMTMVTENPSVIMAGILFDAKSDESIKDNDGLTALDLAKAAMKEAPAKEKANYQDIIDLLSEKPN